MRTVLIGSDFMYDKDGNLKPIEINTSVGWDNTKIESDDESIDLTSFSNFVQTNEFTKVTFIGSKNAVISSKLESLLNSLNMEFIHIITSYDSITVPYVEDSATHLIIRQSYDATALVDDTYCRSKVEFMKLIKDQSYGSQFAYMDENNTLVSNITTIPDNGNQPNFILKSVEPNYDKEVYPKFYKVSTQSELDVILQNVTSDYFLMEFLYNPNKLYNNHIQVLRGLNILYPPSLESIQIAEYTKITDNIINENIDYNSETFEINYIERNSFLTNDTGIILPKLLDTDVVEMADGSWKTALDLEVGDVLKTVDMVVDGFDIANAQLMEYPPVTFSQLQSNITYSQNPVTHKAKVSKEVAYVNITFTDDTNWSDTKSSVYLIEDVDGYVTWRALNQVSPGEKILLIDTSDQTTPTLVAKVVLTNTETIEVFSGWVITVDRAHVFLTKTNQTDTLTYAAIEHNVGCADAANCTQSNCPKGQICCYRPIKAACGFGLGNCNCA
jgi:hypothetical protein